MSDRLKLAITFALEVVILIIALFVEELRRLPPVLLILLIGLAALLQVAVGPTVDLIRQKTANERLRRQARRLHLAEAHARRELNEFQEVIVSFLEHSHIYRERLKDHLKLTEDYLCIVKSSEGLSDVFNAMERKTMLPFGAVLMRIAGAIRPFENIGLFLIPVKSLPGIDEWNIRAYIAKEIMPEVEKEREAFLASLPRKVADKAEPLSYKYMAFLLRKGSIAHDLRNRKFNREFNAFIVEQQGSGDFSTMKNALEEMVRAKDLLALVNWSSFAKLNDAQRALVEKHRERMSACLHEAGIDVLSAVASTGSQRFFEIVWPALIRKTTKRKAFNISKRVVEGASRTVDVLARNGITL